jgi:hypothetical protein
MAEWPDDLLAGSDRPRPLPPALRQRLEEHLLSGADAARPLDSELSARLASDLSDPVAVALADADGPRDLSPELRRRLQSRIGRRHRRARQLLAAAAAVVVVIAGAGVLVRRATESRSSAGRPVAASAPASTVPGALSAGPKSQGGVAAVSPTAGSGAGAANRLDQAAPSAVNPPGGPSAGGTWVTITGNGFTGATAVRFGETAAAPFVVISDGQLRVLTPAHPAGVVDVTVVTGAGTRVAGRYSYGS